MYYEVPVALGRASEQSFKRASGQALVECLPSGTDCQMMTTGKWEQVLKRSILPSSLLYHQQPLVIDGVG